jgi:hypothetical protein
MASPMNSSFYFLDRATHVKIVLLAAVFAGVVVAIGESAQLGRSAHPVAPLAAMPGQAARAVKVLSGPTAKPGTTKPAVLSREAA